MSSRRLATTGAARAKLGCPVVCSLLVGLGLGAVPVAGQVSDARIVALQKQAVDQGWTFTVGRNGATDRNLDDLCGLREPQDWRRRARFDPCTATRGLPTSFDWRDLDGCTPVKDQGSCGSCWAFATVGALECAVKIKDHVEVDLSEQWLVSCNQDGWGCNGGWVAHDYHMWKTDSCGGTGAVFESDFPYRQADSRCDCPYPHQYLIESWAYIGSGVGGPSIAAIKQAILDYGPVAVCIYADNALQAYTGGVFNACTNDATANHEVVLVGWDDNQGSEGVWFLRNSWGADWGEHGYMRIEYGCSKVGRVASYVDYPGYDSLEITPHRGLLSVGDSGGPFTSACQTYRLTNGGTDSLSWTATKTADWLEVQTSNGALDAGDSTTVDVCISSKANSLPGEVYTDTFTFTNQNTGFARTRQATLSIGPLFEVPIGPDHSALTAELCLGEVCDSDESNVTGTVTPQLNTLDDPTAISLFDFELALTDDLNLELNWGFFGSLTSTTANVVVRHPSPGVPVGPVALAASEFLFTNIPLRLEGTLSYTAIGIPCGFLEAVGLSCSHTYELAALSAQVGDFAGTITINDRTVSLVSQIDMVLLEEMATVRVSGVIQGQVFVPESMFGDFDGNGDVDLLDHAGFLQCLAGPEQTVFVGECSCMDFDHDGDVDLGDYTLFSLVLTD